MAKVNENIIANHTGWAPGTFSPGGVKRKSICNYRSDIPHSVLDELMPESLLALDNTRTAQSSIFWQ